MVARAFMSGLARGAATPPVIGPIWDEQFNQANFAAFVAQYNTNDAFGYDGTESAYQSVSGSKMTLQQGAAAAVSFGPDLFTAVRECWFHSRLVITNRDFPLANGIPLGWFLYGDDTAFACECLVDAGHPTIFAVDDVYESIVWGSPEVADLSSQLAALPQGTHDFYHCISEPSAGVLQGELWLNPSPGDSPIASASTARDGSGTISRIAVTMSPPTTSGEIGTPGSALVSLDRCTLWAGSRASNPFGIL